MLRIDERMTHELKNTFCDISASETTVEEQNVGTRSRQNLAGGTGVFANFFEEMAEPLSLQSSNPNDDSLANTLENDCRLQEQMSEAEEINPCFHDELSPMQAFYGDNSDDDLKILERYRMLINQNVDFKTCYGDESQLGRSTNDNAIKCGSLPRGVVTEYNPTDLSSQLCISYIHRSKPPKILANRFLLGSTIGRGSYGKVKDAIDLFTLRRHAVKIISKLGVRKIPGGWNQALHEVSLMRRLSACRHVVSLVTVLRLQNPDRLCLVMEHCLGSVHDLQAAGVPSNTLVSSENEFESNETSGKHETLKDDGLHDEDTTKKSSVLKLNKIRRFHTRLPMISTQIHQELDSKISKLKNRKVSSVEHSTRRTVKNSSQQTQQQQQQQQFRRLPESQAHAYFLQLIDGLHFLHRNGVIHRDIKPANLLLTPAPGCGLSEFGSPNGTVDLPDHNWLCGTGGQSSFCGRSLADLLAASRGWLVKLADFGVSASVSAFNSNDMISGGQTTPAVQPPEVAKGVQSIFDGAKLDVYSAGVTLYFMLTGHVPFSCQNVLQIFEAIVKGDYTIPGHVSTNASDLIRKMMLKDPKKRLSLLQIRQHIWCIQDPVPPMSVEKIKEKLRNELTQSDSTPTKRRGIICWLNPLVYLRRSNSEYPSPHIDDTGARIFTAEEIIDNSEEQLTSTEGGVICNDDTAVAPFSVIDRLKVYHDLDDDDDEHSKPEDMSSFFYSPEACLQYSGIESHLANLGIVPCCPHESESKLQFQSAYPVPMNASHNDSAFNKDNHLSDNNIQQKLSHDISLPVYEASQPPNFTTDAKNQILLPEPPACPADLPVSVPTASYRLPPTFELNSCVTFRTGSLPDASELIPSNSDGGYQEEEAVEVESGNVVDHSSNQKTWHCGSRFKKPHDYTKNSQTLPDIDQVSSDFDTDDKTFIPEESCSSTTHRKKDKKHADKELVKSCTSSTGGPHHPHNMRKLTRWFSNSFTSFRHRIQSLRQKELTSNGSHSHGAGYSAPTQPALSSSASSSAPYCHRTVNSAAELTTSMIIDKPSVAVPNDSIDSSGHPPPTSQSSPKISISRMFTKRKFSIKK
ncbi:unnamed protein product [Trichobilharzia szidati]|nr:unnamed protein product [Trichobilharzia szidati]